MKDNHYWHLTIMVIASFLSMYILMYAMVNAFSNLYRNVNQLYMAGLMTVAMVVIELVVMRAMYEDSRRNAAIMTAAVAVGLACFTFIREQTGVSDRQFLQSMIPHHASAILMCKHASIQDREIRSLCGAIISSQQAEIDQMQAKLRALGK